LSEALAVGLPVITTTGGGMSAQVLAACGTLVAPHAVESVVAQLQLWLNAPDERQRVGADARRFAADNFRISTYIEQLTELYATLL
jgi:glycosyltransferase involved in cell wall biosynthesis